MPVEMPRPCCGNTRQILLFGFAVPFRLFPPWIVEPPVLCFERRASLCCFPAPSLCCCPARTRRAGQAGRDTASRREQCYEHTADAGREALSLLRTHGRRTELAKPVETPRLCCNARLRSHSSAQVNDTASHPTGRIIRRHVAAALLAQPCGPRGPVVRRRCRCAPLGPLRPGTAVVGPRGL